MWRAASRRQKATIVVALSLAVAAVASRPLRDTPLVPAHSAPSAAATMPSASPTLSAAATQAVADAPTPSVARTAAPTPSRSPATPAPAAPPTPQPTAAPTLVLGFTSLTSPVAKGSRATATVNTNPAASCTIEVVYRSGAATAGGLHPQTADGSGVASWSWQVGPKTASGTGPVTVTCSSAGLQKSVTRKLTVS